MRHGALRFSAVACRADYILRGLWPGLLPPPPVIDNKFWQDGETNRLARWCARWTKGVLLKSHGVSRPPPWWSERPIYSRS